MPAPPSFKLKTTPTNVTLAGYDDIDLPFRITLDRVWAMNLVLELEGWLSGSAA